MLIISFILILLNGSLIFCKLLSVTDSTLAKYQSPVYFVIELIKDFNKKRPGVNDVAIFNKGKSREVSDTLKRLIPEDNAVFAPSIERCKSKNERVAAFIIITADIDNNVSNTNWVVQ